MKDVAGKVAFITGGASGLGLAMARSLSGAGMKVVIADIEDSALAAVDDEFSDSNTDVLTIKIDVTDRDSMSDAANKTIEAFGKVHVLCNNAGVFVGGNVSDMTYKDWDWVMNVNVQGVINGMVTFVDLIKSHGEGGHIVNTASIAGHIGIAGLSVYNMSKFAVQGLSEAMRPDLAQFNIGTSVLCPGVVATNIFNAERNRPDDLKKESTQSRQSGTGSSAAEGRGIGSMMDNILQPSVIGDMVLDAIVNDVFYIFSHPSFKERVGARGEEIAAAFDRWENFRNEHNI
ncbi:MAG: short-chain dehydrogenase [OM182 bacterium MED-G24]|uniref:Short-chain dehydrogenase n=1 Tax=OM182 bacterium MED-G24 TaxID=1986255 RepID=A0A2A5WV89_9GAMM|nr:MAG: short-chain dehydrogenase [OM182 bacterium MED-G24]|tara:strand:- start:19496 stop:20359 length:864 start_codon:yes stop_codon:yes gene_type:complete